MMQVDLIVCLSQQTGGAGGKNVMLMMKKDGNRTHKDADRLQSIDEWE